MMGDIAVLTGGEAIFKDLGIALDAVQITDLGKAKKVIVGAENTTIVSGGGTKDAINGRAAQIRQRSKPQRVSTIARNYKTSR